MINVLIAEDELLIRMGLKASIPWEELGFHIVASVPDGQKAWDSYQKYLPDVIITDIRMPKLDGIELIKKVRENDSRCKIIVITCIEYFDIIYQSLNYNITGYLLKASMTHSTLYNLLRQVKRELTSSDVPSDQKFNPDLSINDQLHKYLIDRTISLNELIATVPNLRINTTEQGYLLTVYCGHISKDQFQSITGTLKEELSFFGDLLVICNVDRIYIFIQSQQSITSDMIFSVINDFCEYMKDIFSLHLRFTFALAEKFGELPIIVDMSNHFIDQPYFFPENIIYINDRRPYRLSFDILESLRNNLSCHAFFEGDIKEYFYRMIDQLKINYGTDKSAFITFLSKLAYFISDFCFCPEKKEALNSLTIASYNNAPEALNALWKIVPLYSPHPIYSRKILETIHYIHNNYRDNISITQLASMLNVSSNYYAILFRKMTDFNFTNFVIGIRLYHARRMLRDTTLSMSLITDNCGFSDAAYFSKIFKQNYGISPRQYRITKQEVEY